MTDQVKPSPGVETLRWVEHALALCAGKIKLNVRAVPELASQAFEGGQESPSARLEARDLPSIVRGLQIGRYAVLLGLLPEVAREDEIVETLRRFRNQCVVARSHLSPNAALDLQLILVGPRGSEPSDPWHALALMVERDERVARKLVWLRPVEAAKDAESFDDFTKRTFLARPWEHEGFFSMAPLDNIGRAATEGEVPRTTAGEWIKLATEIQSDPAALVDGLVAAWARRGAA
jgi:hypothetical protein